MWGFVVAPCDCGGVVYELGALHGGESCGFWEPLIPADELSDGEILEVVCLVATVSWCEVVFFVEVGVVWDVGFAVFSDDFALG